MANETYEKVKLVEKMPEMSMFEVQLYSEKDEEIPEKVLKNKKFLQKDETLNIKEDRNGVYEEVITNPSGEIRVKEEGPSVTINSA